MTTDFKVSQIGERTWCYGVARLGAIPGPHRDRSLQVHPDRFIKFIKTDLYTLSLISQAKNSWSGHSRAAIEDCSSASRVGLRLRPGLYRGRDGQPTGLC